MDNDKNKNNQTEQEKKAAAEAEKAAKLEADLRSKDEELQKLSTLLKNPKVEALLSALEKGKEVDIVDVPGTTEASLADLIAKSPALKDAEVKDKFNDLTPRQILDIVASATQEALTQTLANAEKSISGKFGEQKATIDKVANAVLALYSKAELDSVKQTHKDFNKYASKVKTMVESKPGLSIEDAYKLAKFEDISSSPSRESVDTERPGSHVETPDLTEQDLEDIKARRSKASEGVSTFKDPTAIFRSALDAGIDRAMAKMNDSDFE